MKSLSERRYNPSCSQWSLNSENEKHYNGQKVCVIGKCAQLIPGNHVYTETVPKKMFYLQPKYFLQ